MSIIQARTVKQTVLFAINFYIAFSKNISLYDNEESKISSNSIDDHSH